MDSISSPALSRPLAKARSMRLRSERSIPAWWMPMPLGKSSCTSLRATCALRHLENLHTVPDTDRSLLGTATPLHRMTHIAVMCQHRWSACLQKVVAHLLRERLTSLAMYG